LENEIMNFSESNHSGVWVTTQIVEASLDIDFDHLFTELSTVDGLFQRMGRCYRKRDLIEDNVNVTIFIKKPSGVGNIIDRDIFLLSKSALMPFNNKRISEKDKLSVVGEVYSMEKIRGTNYYKGIKQRVGFLQNIPAYEFDRHEVDEKFRNIRSYTVIPVSIYDKNKVFIHETIAYMKELGFSKEERIEHIKRLEEVKELTVDVSYFLIKNKNIVDEVSIDRKNTVKIINLEYDNCLGLTPNERIINIL
jgi:CRISPR-associated endonuclease/helicase Cas3